MDEIRVSEALHGFAWSEAESAGEPTQFGGFRRTPGGHECPEHLPVQVG
ncbi:MAG TPA: hypothetical protein VMH35_12500 [Streptosporangiaceae bacterium]|nr:hypothetical protein [Streptosporangiaceae bacterium]